MVRIQLGKYELSVDDSLELTLHGSLVTVGYRKAASSKPRPWPVRDKPGNNGFSTDQERKALELLKASNGYQSHKSIFEETGVPLSILKRMAHENGLFVKPTARSRPGSSEKRRASPHAKVPKDLREKIIELRRDGQNYAEIREAVGVNNDRISYVIKRYAPDLRKSAPRLSTAHEAARARDLHSRGMTPEQVAIQIGKSPRRVLEYLAMTK